MISLIALNEKLGRASVGKFRLTRDRNPGSQVENGIMHDLN
jgi:hypothetical protein